MDESTIWWLLAGTAVAVELMTGTFYLLMLTVGLVAGALAAHLGLAPVGQMVVAAIIGGGAVAAWHWYRGQKIVRPILNPLPVFGGATTSRGNLNGDKHA